MKKIIFCFLIFSFCLSISIFSFGENDFKSHELLFEKEILKKDDSYAAMTDDLFTRAEMTVILSRLSGLENKVKELNVQSTFEDVQGHWAENYITFAQLQLWTNGYSDTEFKPDQRLSKLEFSEFILRFLGYHSIGTNEWQNSVEDLKAHGIIIKDEEPSTEDIYNLIVDIIPLNSHSDSESELVDTPSTIDIIKSYLINQNTIQIEVSKEILDLKKEDYQLNDEADNLLIIDSVMYTPWDNNHTEIFINLEEPLAEGHIYILSTENDTAKVSGTIKSNIDFTKMKNQKLLFEESILKSDNIYEILTDDILTRAEMMVILSRLNGSENNVYEFSLLSSFKDAKGHWAENYIAYAELQEWTNGHSMAKFKPDQPLTKSEFSEFILRFLGYHSIGTEEWKNSVEDLELLGIVNEDINFSTGSVYNSIIDIIPLYSELHEDTETEVTIEEIHLIKGFSLSKKVIEIEVAKGLLNLEKEAFQLKDQDNNIIDINELTYSPEDTNHTKLVIYLNEPLIVGKLYNLSTNKNTIEVTTVEKIEEPLLLLDVFIEEDINEESLLVLEGKELVKSTLRIKYNGLMGA